MVCPDAVDGPVCPDDADADVGLVSWVRPMTKSRALCPTISVCLAYGGVAGPVCADGDVDGRDRLVCLVCPVGSDDDGGGAVSSVFLVDGDVWLYWLRSSVLSIRWFQDGQVCLACQGDLVCRGRLVCPAVLELEGGAYLDAMVFLVCRECPERRGDLVCLACRVCLVFLCTIQ